MPDLAQLEAFLESRLFGQREAIADFSSAILRAEGGPKRPGRPKAFVLLLGPTGTGKTEMVHLTARFLYGADAARRLERFDMGEYQHPDSVKRLLGAPDQPPLLGQAIDRLNARGGGMLLLDEIEKAFPDLLTVLLSFDSARSTMFDGTTRDLTALIVVLTSNLGAAEAARMEFSGYSSVVRQLRHAAEERFKKEGVARFTAVCCLTALSYAVQQRIARQILAAELRVQSEHLHRAIEADDGVLTFLIGKAFSPDLGARHVRNCVERYVGEALRPITATNEINGDAAPGAAVIADRWSSAIVLTAGVQTLMAGPVPRSAALAQLLSSAGATSPSLPLATAGVD